MHQFVQKITTQWNISDTAASAIVVAFEKGDTPWYLSDYIPALVAEVEPSQLWEIYDFLRECAELIPKKKRLLASLKKENKLTAELETRIEHSCDNFELDDLMIPFRPNSRTKGRIALGKGLGELADLIMQQEATGEPIETLIESYKTQHPDSGSVESMADGVRNILAERFAYDDTVRTMVREFVYDDGNASITLKEKDDAALAQFRERSYIPLRELAPAEALQLLVAEEAKRCRVKIDVHLFRITELLKHHFITNSDADGYSLISDAIDECWLRLLQPVIERDVKIKIHTNAQIWALRQIMPSLMEKIEHGKIAETFFSVGLTGSSNAVAVALNTQGQLFGGLSIKKALADPVGFGDRLRQLYNRYHPSFILIPQDEQSEALAAMIRGTFTGTDIVIRTQIMGEAEKKMASSEWLVNRFAELDTEMRGIFALGILYAQPISLLAEIGSALYTIHPLMALVPAASITDQIARHATQSRLREGLQAKDLTAENLAWLGDGADKFIKHCAAATLNSKNDLLSIEGMTDVLFRNLSGYFYVADAVSALDRSLVHPSHFDWIGDICNALNISHESLLQSPESVRSYPTDDLTAKLYIEKRLIPLLMQSQERANSAPRFESKRKLKLTEISEGVVLTGRVTNITPFGVFVNINAVCDGLIHISQLADSYVESPDQVVSVNELVDVRVLKVDIKKRRISLSMKGLGPKGPRVKPTKGHLDTLATHFANR